MSTYILIHGAMHGAWCWERVIPQLQSFGHTVVVPDLPGHGADRSPRATVTLAHYIACVNGLLESAAQPVILVGHSMGGMIVSAAADAFSAKVRHLVYLAAVVPKDGESMMEASGHALRPNEAFAGGMQLAEGGASHRISAAAARATFFSDLSEDDAAAAYSRLTPQPNTPLDEKVRLTSGGLERVPRTYIFCENDQALIPAQQQRAIDRSPGIRVLRLAGGHSPFLSRPQRLAELLHGLAAYSGTAAAVGASAAAASGHGQ
jgi:pimeloyl-ACP methyl ester carboxylesterase